ncbi:MAG: VWA domain-containing protein [Anaerolineae bacterium]|nr:VWA domain-containing protein [Anaerolineae bacterium]
MTSKKAKDSGPQQDPAVVIAFLLDETGSMSSVRDATISGFNEYVDTVKGKHPDALLSLRLFSTEKYDKVTELTPLPLAPRMSHDNYKPSGGTPLYDCVARLISETETATTALKPVPEILFVIMTDGEENSSREFNRARIFQLISQKTELGWTFVFLGANQDAWAVGQSIGVRQASSMTYDATTAGTRANFAMMSEATSRHMDKRKMARSENPAAAPQAEDFFTDEDAEKLGKKRPPKDTDDS